MRGKIAKELRGWTVFLPPTSYKDVAHKPKKVLVGYQTSPTGELVENYDEVVPTTRVLVEGCARAVYKGLKRRYRRSA